ncbi:hypothetical protein DAI22_03g207501 [Oryza sativa Japonica Group]|nr:hypothetical protein DAI22_03g207501 [Oryza sativa Japonica Group]
MMQKCGLILTLLYFGVLDCFLIAFTYGVSLFRFGDYRDGQVVGIRKYPWMCLFHFLNHQFLPPFLFI